MDTRREFIKKAGLLSGAAGLFSNLPASVQKALSIDPAFGSTYLDAEHVVILMQENRSFDHCYGTLKGVRGYNDPRAALLPNKLPVWFQQNEQGETYAPFRLNIKDTRATFLGSLPHSWSDQVDARNNGHHDKWLTAKKSGHEGFETAPLSLGYYNRVDIPFYYSLADAFTVCDQNFCSSLTGTTPNRLYLWTGTIRPEQHPDSPAHVYNGDTDYEKEKSWTTFPEILEENDIPWKIYQNEISLESGLTDDEDSWLANFTDNPIEWFSQFQVRFSPSYQAYMARIEPLLPPEIATIEAQLKNVTAGSEEAKKLERQLKQKRSLQKKAAERHQWSAENFEKLSQTQKNLHSRAFANNSADPDFRKLDTLTYQDGKEQREMKIPKGDILHQFRADVNSGSLPAVSWVVGPANFSDHPGAPWYGAWYVSEVLDILTSKPEVWKKTIFILCYDENDGYYDHVPPFVPPHPERQGTGLVSQGIDTAVEYVTLAQDRKTHDEQDARESPIGLGYRVPLVIASPWSRGGAVCSQVFDHTSILMLMEKLLSKKKGKPIRVNNISSWRRAVCGDLSAVFRPFYGEKTASPDFPGKKDFYQSIHKTQFKKDPRGYTRITEQELKTKSPAQLHAAHVPRQEKGTRPSCSIPYELFVDLHPGPERFEIRFEAAKAAFGEASAGAAFMAYAILDNDQLIRNYAVLPGDAITDTWDPSIFGAHPAHFRVHGPNGFFREFKQLAAEQLLSVNCNYERKKGGAIPSGRIEMALVNLEADTLNIVITDNAYGAGQKIIKLGAKPLNIVLDTARSFGWYDFSVKIQGNQHFEMRYAGHVETGELSRTDPFMGGEIKG